MGSEAEVKCDFCGYEYPSVRRSCPKCSQHGPTGNPFPPQAEVVATSRPEVPPSHYGRMEKLRWMASEFDRQCIKPNGHQLQSVTDALFGTLMVMEQRLHAIESQSPSESPATKRGEKIPCHRCRYMTFSGSICNKCGAITIKESPCSSGSQGVTAGSTGITPSCTESRVGSSSSESPSSSSPSSSNPPAWATPQILAACKPGEVLCHDHTNRVIWSYRGGLWWDTERGLNGVVENRLRLRIDESYTIPTPPPDKPKPEAKDPCGCAIVCSKCCPVTTKPKPDDAEEVARKILSFYEEARGAYPTLTWDDARAKATAAIRADRQKHADLADRVKLLARFVENAARTGSEMHQVAREVLAMMEER